MRVFVLAVLFAALAAPAMAQMATITGRVIDARTEQPLRGVVIMIDGQPSLVETDADGRFTMVVAPGSYDLSAALVGYAWLRQPVSADAAAPLELEIRLSEGAGAFEERVTVVGATNTASEHGAGATTLHGRELQALRGVTMDDPLRSAQSLPAVSAPDDFHGEFAIRGLPFRQLALTVDTLPTRYLMHSVHGVTDGGSIAMINGDAVGSLSVSPGSHAQRIGNHLGGQVGIAMREGDRERTRARGGLSGTSAALTAEGPLAEGRGSWLVSGRRSYVDWLLKRIDADADLAFAFSDVEAKLVFDVTPRHRLEVLAIGGRSAFEEAEEGLGPNDERTVDGQSWLAGLSWRFTPSSRVSFTQRVYSAGLNYQSANTNRDSLDDHRSADLGARSEAVFAAAPWALVEVGAEVQRITGRHARQRAFNDSAALTPVADYRATHGAAGGYARLELKPWSRLSIAPGVRYDRWQATSSSAVSPWVIATMQVTAHTAVTASAAQQSQFAELDQIYGVQGGGRDLRPERARHLDVSLVQRLPYALSLELSAFNRHETGLLATPFAEPRMIDNEVVLGHGDDPWRNARTGEARGIEVLLRRDSASGLSGWFGYAFGDYAQTGEDGESFAADFDQRHAVSVFARYPLSNRMSIGAKVRYGTNYPLMGYIGPRTASPNQPPLFGGGVPLFYTLTDTRNSQRLPAYFRVDLRVDRTFTWGSRRATLFAEVANTTDHTNLRNVPYGVDRMGRVFDPTGTLLPIIPSAGLSIEF